MHSTALQRHCSGNCSADLRFCSGLFQITDGPTVVVVGLPKLQLLRVEFRERQSLAQCDARDVKPSSFSVQSVLHVDLICYIESRGEQEGRKEEGRKA